MLQWIRHKLIELLLAREIRELQWRRDTLEKRMELQLRTRREQLDAEYAYIRRQNAHLLNLLTEKAMLDPTVNIVLTNPEDLKKW